MGRDLAIVDIGAVDEAVNTNAFYFVLDLLFHYFIQVILRASFRAHDLTHFIIRIFSQSCVDF